MNKQQNKQKLWTTHIYIYISCKCDTNRAGHFTLDAYASRPVACSTIWHDNMKQFLWWWEKILNIIQWDQSIIATSNGSWRQGIKGETTCTVYWPAHRAGLLRCNFFGQPGSVSKFPPFLWVKLWVGWVGRGYIEISRYFPALWINRVTLVTKIKLWHSLGYQITYESPKCLYGMLFFVSKPDSIFSVFHSSPSSHVRSSLIGW